MELGIIGAGRMGANLARRLARAGHRPVVTDVDPAALEPLAAEGIDTAASVEALAHTLSAPRAVWVMVPAGVVDRVVESLVPHLATGDTVIDGGNSNWNDDLRRASALADVGLHYLDIGTSGGVHGLDRGYCLMIGGPDAPVRRLEPIWAALAPGVDAAERTLGRSGSPLDGEAGWLHCGPSGAGHFVKMVHNGIEYGLMAAYAEGLNVLTHAGAGRADHPHDAETAPLRDPAAYQYDFDLAAIAELWRRGSVVGSWLLDLTATALAEDSTLAGFGGQVSDSGEGRWTLQAGIETGAPTPVLAAAVYERFSSRGEATFANQVLSAMRKQFGGHAEKGQGGGHAEKGQGGGHAEKGQGGGHAERGRGVGREPGRVAVVRSPRRCGHPLRGYGRPGGQEALPGVVRTAPHG